MSPAAPLFTPSRIIVHHSAGGDTDSNNTAGIRAYHISLGWFTIGYHATCEQIGGSYEILMGRRWDMVGAHTLTQNDKALGLCLIGNFSLAEPPRAQLIRAAAFVAFWRKLYSIPLAEIFPHKFFNNTECPGNLFPWDNFIDLVQVASA